MTATNIALGMSDGSVWISTDGGATFTVVAPTSGSTGTAPVYVAFGPDGSLYALGSTTAGVNRWVASSSMWLNLGPTFVNGSGLAVTPDGTLYAADSGKTLGVGDGIWRSLYPTAVNSIGAANCQFQQINFTTGFTGMESPATATGLSVVSAMTDNALYTVDTAFPTGTSLYGYNGEILGFDDTMIGMPTLTSPKNGANVTTSVNAAVTWNAVTGATAYQVQSDDTSNAFAGNNMDIVGGSTIGSLTDCTTATSATVGSGLTTAKTLTGGNTYWWEIRAISIDPTAVKNNLDSRWSAGWSFITALPSVATTAIPIAPAMGQQNVPVNSTFSWPAVAGATSYDFVISDATANTSANWFAIIDYGDTTSVNAYVPQTALKYNTQYWWEVRADSGTATGPWTVSTFTTEPMPTSTTATATAPVVTPTVTVINTNPAVTPTVTVINSGTASTTPVIPTYLLWLVIVVGAVLVIAVIVLIVRTRRIS